MIRAGRCFVLALMLLLGCRAVGADSRDSGLGGVEDSGPAPAQPDASTEPTRQEPPVVHVVPNVTVETVAGSAVAGSADGTGATAQFDNPVGVAVESTGALLVTEYDSGRLRRIAPDGTTSTLATGFVQPFGLLATPDAIYVQTDRDQYGNKGPTTGTIWRVSPAGGVPEIVLPNLGWPRGLARLFDGRIAISDRDRVTVSIFNPGDGSMTPLAGAGIDGFFDGKGAVARFDDPYGVSVLPDGSIVLADRENHCIRRVTMDGLVTVFAGDGKPGMRDHTDKLQARFDSPIDVVVDASGNVYVSDTGNHRIRRITAAGVVETIAGDGTAGFADGAGVAARFYGQEQLDITPDGKTLYLADGTNGETTKPPYNRVRRIVIE